MFETTINNTASTVNGGAPVMPPAFSARTFEMTGDRQPVGREQDEQARLKAEENRQSDGRTEVTQKMLDELEQDIESIHSIGLTFARHAESGRTMIKVMDRQSHELIREIPAEEILNLAAKIEEMIGILFDKKV